MVYFNLVTCNFLRIYLKVISKRIVNFLSLALEKLKKTWLCLIICIVYSLNYDVNMNLLRKCPIFGILVDVKTEDSIILYTNLAIFIVW